MSNVLGTSPIPFARNALMTAVAASASAERPRNLWKSVGAVLAGIIVAGWGFLVWMYQLFAGPPGS